MGYEVRFAEPVQKQLDRLPRNLQTRIVARIEGLAEDPRPAASRPLGGDLKGRWRLRVGDYRVIYTIREDALLVLVVSVGHRHVVYDEASRRG